MKKISIPLQEYNRLKKVEEAYNRLTTNRAKANGKAGKVSANKLTPEERSARAKKAVEARIKKYGQKSRGKN